VTCAANGAGNILVHQMEGLHETSHTCGFGISGLGLRSCLRFSTSRARQRLRSERRQHSSAGRSLRLRSGLDAWAAWTLPPEIHLPRRFPPWPAGLALRPQRLQSIHLPSTSSALLALLLKASVNSRGGNTDTGAQYAARSGQMGSWAGRKTRGENRLAIDELASSRT
jgi:hypothetical protein